MSIPLMILLSEIFIMIVCVVVILVIRILEVYEYRRKAKDIEQLKGLVKNAFGKNEPIDFSQFPARFTKAHMLVPIIEFYDQNFKDPEWHVIKQQLLNKYLLPQVQELISSKNWTKRQLALRIISLDAPKLREEKDVLELLKDPVYLVRVAAAKCLLGSKQFEYVLPVIEQMRQETPLARYPYRDLLMHTGKEIYDHLEELSTLQDAPEVVQVCRDVLSTKVHHQKNIGITP